MARPNNSPNRYSSGNPFSGSYRTGNPAPRGKVRGNAGSRQLTNIIETRQLYREKIGIDIWRNAILGAESEYMPRRRYLYQLYNELILDAHLSGIWEKRVEGQTNLTWRLSLKDDPEDDLLDFRKIGAGWLEDFINHWMEAKLWGNSVTEFRAVNGKVYCDLIPRQNVFPEEMYGMISIDGISPDGGIPFRLPQNSRFLVESGTMRGLGYLLKLAPAVIYKRGSFADYATFGEKYAMPFATAEYDPYDPVARAQLEDTLGMMGSNSWAVIPKDSIFKFYESANKTGSNDTYKGLKEACTDEMSIMVLGQTMTTKDGSSNAQSKVHQNEQDSKNKSDEKSLTRELNEKVLPVLANLGISLGNREFWTEDTAELPLKDRIDVDIKVNSVAPIAKKYFYETYGVEEASPEEIKAAADAAAKAANPNADIPNEEEQSAEKVKVKKDADAVAKVEAMAVKLERLADFVENKAATAKSDDIITGFTNAIGKLLKKKPTLNLPDLEHTHEHNHEAVALAAAPDGLPLDVWESIQAGRKISPEQYKFTADALIKGLTFEGLDKAEDEGFKTMMRSSLFRFTAAKTLAQLKQASVIAADAKDFNDFKNKAQPLFDQYNVKYLQSEYEQGVAASQMGSAWHKAENEGNKFFTIQTAGDDRVRPEHQLLEGKVVQMSDPDASRYIPPLDWGCRCDAQFSESTDADPSSAANMASVFDDKTYSRMKTGGFLTNWGSTQQVFTADMDYLKKADFGLRIADWGLPKYKDMQGLGEVQSGHELQSLIDNPDEAYMVPDGEGYKYTHFKFYKNGAHYINLTVDKKGVKRPDTFNITNNPDKLRKGILTTI